jgi:hypothetical protein
LISLSIPTNNMTVGASHTTLPKGQARLRFTSLLTPKRKKLRVMCSEDCIYHRKRRKPEQTLDTRQQEHLNPSSSLHHSLSTAPIVLPDPTVHSLYTKREPNRTHSDDWKSQIRIDWGLPNHLLGYNTTTKSRFEAEVELKRRNVELMDSFETMNDSVAKLLALLSSETAPGLPQASDRSHCGGKQFTLQNYLDLKCSISDKLAKIKS